MIPIVEQGDGSFRCTYQGEELRLRNRQEVDESTNKVADSGSYSRIMAKSEFEEFAASSAKGTALFNQAMVGRVRDWIGLAEERLGRPP